MPDIAGSVQVEALILSANNNLTMQDLSTTFQLPLDDFQQQAVQLFLQGSSVLVCAPTGAGKTAIAEAAAVAVLARCGLPAPALLAPCIQVTIVICFCLALLKQ